MSPRATWATFRDQWGRLRHAIGAFFRGFTGLPGTPGAPPSAEMRDPAAARRALEQRAAQRRNCC